MSLCVVLNPDGTLTQTGQPVADCTGHVLATPAEIYVGEIVAMAFATPDLALAAGWFAGVFSLVVVCYVAGAAVGHVVGIVR